MLSLLLACFGASLFQPALFGQSRTSYVQVVTPGDPRLQWTPPLNVPLGTPLGPAQLSAKAAVSGRFEYSPPEGTVLLTGKHSLAVTFVPNISNYRRASASVFLTVDPPNGSTFQLAWQDPSVEARGVSFNSDGTVKAMLLVKPVGIFAQPITFGCTAPFRYSCNFSPSTIRPTDAPVPVEVTVVLTPANASPEAGARSFLDQRPSDQRPSQDAPWRGSRMMMAAACFLFFDQRRRHSRRRKASLIVLLTLPCLLPLADCGVSSSNTMVKVTASSLVESKSIELPIALPDRSVWTR